MRKMILSGVVVPGVLMALTIVAGMMLGSNFSHAETTSASASVTVAAACTMTANTTSAHSAIVSPGQYTEPIGSTTLSVICNDAGGFSIYAVGNANNEYGNNKLLATVGGTLNSTYDIATGTATSGSISNWAMKVNAVTGTYTPTIQSDTNGSFSSYHIVPTTYTKVASYNSVTGTSVASEVTSTYAAYIKPDQPAGNYDGKVKYTIVHPVSEAPLQPQPATAGCINYFANASNAIGSMGCQSASDGQTKTLLASNFSREGYGFAGWSDAYDYATNPNANFYGPQEDITVPVGTTANGLSLYAVWIKSAGSLQDTSKVATLCGTGAGSLTAAATDGTANLSSVTALTDQRDNNTYAIAKLADGKCWMIENLRLENTGAHNSDGTLAQGYGTSTTYGNFSGLADAEPAWANNITTANSLYYSGTQDGTASVDIGTGSSPGYRFPRYNNVNTPTTASDRPQNPTTNSATNTTSNAGMYSYGNYYTWHAAIADTTAYSSGDHNTTSICPTGWSIPLGNTSTGDIEQGASDPANKVGGFSYLDRKMGGTGATQSTTADSLRWRKYPVNFVYSGGVVSGSLDNRGSTGYYWSSTAYSSFYAYPLSLNSSSVYPGTDRNFKCFGRAIRCLVAPGS